MKAGSLLLFCTLWLLPSQVFAQQGSFTLSGTVKDGDTAVAYAYISAKNTASPMESFTFSDEQGNFILESLPAGTYLITISMTGYQEFRQDSLNINANQKMPVIQLVRGGHQLESVTIVAQKPLITVKPGMIVANIATSVLASGNSVFEVLGKMPGVHIDNNDVVNLKGKSGVQIWMDGKPTLMAGSDLANMLRGMSSANIERIEIISSPGARYDAEGIGGIINIITKKDKRNGVNGSANISYGQGMYPKYGIGGNISYRKKKWIVNANYQFNKRFWFNNLVLDRNFLDENNQRVFQYYQDNYALYNFKNHIAAVSVDYSFSHKTTIGMAFSGMTNAFQPTVTNNTDANDGMSNLLYTTLTTGNHDNLYYNAGANASLRHSFDSTGRSLSVDVDYAQFGSRSNQHFASSYRKPDGQPYLDDYYLKSDLRGSTDIRSVKADYVHPVQDSLRIEAGLKSSYVISDSKPLFYQKSSGEYELDTTRSNHFIYKENINAGYLNLNKDYKSFGLQLGLRMEHTHAKGIQYSTQTAFDTAYIQLFPNLAFQYHLNEKNDLGITLSRRIERPDYQQLNPFKYYIDKTTYREGYPYLNPASYYSAELTHTYRQRFVTTLSYGVNRGFIMEVIQPSETEDSVTVQTVKNANRMTFAGLYTSYPFQVMKKWTAYTGLNIYYAHYKADVANTSLDKGALTFNVNVQNTFLLPYNMMAELSFNYRAREQYGYMVVRPNWMLNAGLQKHFLDKKLSLKLNVQDIFFTGYPRATSTYMGYEEHFVAKRETRVGTLTLSYNFGSEQVNTGRRRSGAEEEKRRANNNGA